MSMETTDSAFPPDEQLQSLIEVAESFGYTWTDGEEFMSGGQWMTFVRPGPRDVERPPDEVWLYDGAAWNDPRYKRAWDVTLLDKKQEHEVMILGDDAESLRRFLSAWEGFRVF